MEKKIKAVAKQVAEQVGIFGDFIENIAIKFMSKLFGMTEDEFRALLPALIALIKWLAGKIGVKETIRVVGYMGKNPKKVYMSVVQMMDQGE
jgi:hypothetical protein